MTAYAWLSRKGAILVLLAICLAQNIAHADDFFPIGIYDAGVARLYPNDIAKFYAQSNHHAGQSPTDTAAVSKYWSTLDEVRGNTVSDASYGYTSSINVVADYGHGTLWYPGYAPSESEASYRREVGRYLDAANALGFKVMVMLPAMEESAAYRAPAVGLRHFFQRPTPQLNPATSLIGQFKDHPALYAWYLADEPGGTAFDPNRFHTSAISASKLRAAYGNLKPLDGNTPFIYNQPDYTFYDSTKVDCGSTPADSAWLWANQSCPDKWVHPIPNGIYAADSMLISPNYRQCADMVIVDTYINAGVGGLDVPSQFLGWKRILRQYDVVDSTTAGGFQAELECFQYCPENTAPDDSVKVNGKYEKCHSIANANCGWFSRDEMAFQMYTALIHAARGIWFQSYAYTFDECTAAHRWAARFDTTVSINHEWVFRDAIVPLSNELKEITPFLTGAATVVGRRRWSDNTTAAGTLPTVSQNGASIQLSLLVRDREALLIAANVSQQSVTDVDLNFGALASQSAARFVADCASAEVLFENGRAGTAITHGVLRDSFAPRGVHLYRFKKRQVPGDYSDLSTALTAWNPGEVLYVGPNVSNPPTGAWVGTVAMTAGMSLVGLGNPILDASGQSYGATISTAGSTYGASLTGFTVKNYATAGVSIGAGGLSTVRVEGCTFKGGQSGVSVTANGNADLVACTVDSAVYGFDVTCLNPSTVNITRNVVRAPQGGGRVGIRVQGAISSGKYTIERNTVTGTWDGILVGSTSAGVIVSVKGNVIHGASGSGIDGSSSIDTLLHNDSFGNIANFTGCGGPLPSGNISADPQLCSDNIQVNISSPCAPWMNAWNEWLGASSEVGCLYGTLSAGQFVDNVRNPSGQLEMPSNLVIPSGVTFGLYNRTVSAASSAAVVVDGGTLIASGATVQKKVGGSNWPGIQVRGGSVNLTSCTIRDANLGIDFSAAPSGQGGGTVSLCTLSNLTTEGIRVNNSATITIDRSTINCPTSSNFVGIHVGTNANGPIVRGSVVNGTNAAGSRGIFCESGVSLLGNKIINFKYTSSGIGIDLATDSAAVILVDKYNGPDGLQNSIVENCRTAVYIENHSRPKIRNTRVKIATYGFWVTATAAADLGTEFPQSENGLSDVTNITTRFVRADAPRIAGWNDINAVLNWWGTDTLSVISAKMGAGVTWQPYLASDPLAGLSARGPALTPIDPVSTLFAVRPNPAFGSATLFLNVPSGRPEIRVRVFSVGGRRIREIAFEGAQAGDAEILWDGNDDNGAPVPSGIYYIQAIVGKSAPLTRKLVVVR